MTGLRDAYDCCVSEGQIVDWPSRSKIVISSLLSTSSILAESAIDILSALKPDDPKHLSVYILYYDAIHSSAEALMRCKGKRSRNHACLFAYICSAFPFLGIDWLKLDAIRQKRNESHYYGELLTATDWKSDGIFIQSCYKTIFSEATKLLQQFH
jgi:hypothetical protein